MTPADPAAVAGHTPSGGGLAIAWRFAWRELRAGWRAGLSGFRVFLAVLALGVAAIAAVGSLSAALQQGVADDARALLGGDVAFLLVHRPADAAERAFLASQGRLSAIAEMRAMAESPATGQRRLVELKAVDSAWPLYGEARLAPATDLATVLAPRPAAATDDATDAGAAGVIWGAAVEANLLPALGLQPEQITAGPPPRIQVGDALFEIRATIAYEPDRGAQLFTLGPRLLVSDQALAATGLVQPGSLVRYAYRLASTDSAAAITARATDRFPDAGWRSRTTADAGDGISRFMGRLALFLTLVGLAALLTGGVGVSNAVAAYMDSRRPTIAALKCLGASTRLIFQVYMVQVLALATLATLIGVALGALAPLAVGGLLSGFAGVDLASGPFWRPLALAGLFGLLVAVTFSWLPLARARRVPAAHLFRPGLSAAERRLRPAELATTGALALALGGLAIVTAERPDFALWFTLGAAVTLAVFRLVAEGVSRLARRLARQVGGGRALLRLALANLGRPAAPAIPVIVSLGLGLTLLVTVGQIRTSLTAELGQRMAADAPAYFFIDIQPGQVAAFDTTVRATPGLISFNRVPSLRGTITAINDVAVADMTIPPDVAWAFRGDRGLTWSAVPVAGGTLVAGQWWPADYAGPPLVSLDANIARGVGLAPGDAITLNVLGRPLTATVANLRQIDWESFGLNFTFVFAPGALDGAPQTHIATVDLAPESEPALERAVAAAFPNVSSVRVRDTLNDVRRLLSNLGLAIALAAGATLVAGTLVLAGAIAAGHRRRVYDAVVLKVLGATRGRLLAAYLLEYGLLGLMTAGLAAAIGLLAAWAVVRFVMTLAFRPDPAALGLTIVIATLVVLAAGFAGTFRALSAPAAPELRND